MNFRSFLNLLIPFIIINFSVKAQKIDPSFQLPTPITSANIRSIKAQNDGKILVGGTLNYFESNTINNLIRLNENGTLDETFNYESTEKVYEINLQSNGNILINTSGKLLQLNSSGSIIETIDSLKFIRTFIVQPDDKIIVIGLGGIEGSSSFPILYRFNADMTPDVTFKQNNNFDDYLTDVALQGDKIIVSGRFKDINGISKNDIARFTSAGSLDETFDIGTGSDDGIGSITVQENGKILIGNCYLNNFNGDNSVPAFIRLNVDGDRDFSFNTPNIDGPVSEIFVHDSTIYYEAFHYYSPDSSGNYFFRIDSLGNNIESFKAIDFYDSYNLKIEFSSNDEILSNGLALKGNSFGLSRYNINGELDESFMPEIGSIGSYEIGSYYNGKLVISGDFLRIGDQKSCKLAMINEDGSVSSNFVFDESFTSNASNRKPSQIKFLNDTTIYVSLGNELVKLNNKGEVYAEFSRQGITDPEWFVSQFKILENNKIVTASPNGVFMLNADGSKDDNFNIPNFNGAGSTFGIGTLSSGILYHSYFTEVNGISANQIAKINYDGSVDESFSPGYSEDFNIDLLTVVNKDEFILFDAWGNEKSIKMSADGKINETFRTNFNYSAPSGFYPYSSILFKGDNILISCLSSNGNSFFSLELMDTAGIFSDDFVLPYEITDIKNDIKIVPAEEKSVILFSEFSLSGKTETAYGLKLIYNEIPKIDSIRKEFIIEKNNLAQILLDDLYVKDSDNTYPDDFTLNINSGDNYTVNNNEITPAIGFSGNLSVPVYVNDGIDDSPVYYINIEVTNQIPVITGTTKTFSTQENTAITINLEDLTVNDSDNTYPDDFTLHINAGDNFSVNNNEIKPANGFAGTLSVPLYVNDGIDDSPVYNIEIEVNQTTNITQTSDFDGLKLYPNPSCDFLNIEFYSIQKGIVTINIISLNGAIIKTNEFELISEFFKETILTKEIDPGLYIIDIKLSGTSIKKCRITIK